MYLAYIHFNLQSAFLSAGMDNNWDICHFNDCVQLI